MSEEVDRQVLKRYDIHQKVGKGAYGVVWRARDRKTNEVVAVKKIFDAFQNATDSQRTYREVVFLHELAHHDSVITLLDVMRPSPSNSRDLYLVFEYMDTDLHTAIRAKVLQPVHRRYIIYQLVKTLKYLHNCKILHRDLKPSNILINGSCKIKIADFGLARLIKASPSDKNANTNRNVVNSKSDINNTKAKSSFALTDYVATRWYRAPEILLGSHAYGFPVDMWSVGCILGEMIATKPVFPGTSTMNQIQRIVDVTGRPTQADVDDMQSQYAQSMLESFTHVRVGGGKRRAANEQHKAPSSTVSKANDGGVGKLMRKVSLSYSRYRSRANGAGGGDDSFKSDWGDQDELVVSLSRMFPKASEQELDLMSRLMRFSPRDRLTANQTLRHPFAGAFNACVPDLKSGISDFHSTKEGQGSDGSDDEEEDDEDMCDHEIVMPFDDDVRFSTSQYREKLYAEIENRSREARRRLMALRPAGSEAGIGSGC